MGMYDLVRCEAKTPDGIVGANGQTKAFDRTMVTVRITADGFVEREFGHEEEVPKEEQKQAWVYGWYWEYKWVQDGWEPLPHFTGLLDVGDWDAVILRGRLVGFQKSDDPDIYHEWTPDEDVN